MEAAKAHINSMDADLGGTEIYNPLRYAIDELKASDYDKKRIFLLTDGQVSNSSSIVQLARNSNEKARIHTFGIGSGCDKNMV